MIFFIIAITITITASSLIFYMAYWDKNIYGLEASKLKDGNNTKNEIGKS